MKTEQEKAQLEQQGYTFDCGMWVDKDGYPLCPGVVCRCDDNQFCPLHGKGPKKQPESTEEGKDR